MYNTILVPLDGSTLAEQALPCAIMLARGLPAELVLFRAVSVPPDVKDLLDSTDLEMDEVVERAEVEASNYLSQVTTQVQEKYDLNIHPVIRYGSAAEAMIEFVAQTGVQQIVMATHGYTGNSRWTHGSVAERVLQSASVPVFLIRAKDEKSVSNEAKCYRRILVPLDGSTVAEQVLPRIIAVAKALGAEIVLLQVPIVHIFSSFMGDWFMPIEGDFETATQSAQTYLNRIAGNLKKEGISVSTTLQAGSVADTIIDYAQANQIDLIAICTHGRTGLARWTLGSVADRVLRAGSTPIFLVRAR